MTSQLAGWLSALSGLILFGAAYYIHQRVRLTRTACVIAAAAGFLTYGAAIGGWANRMASQFWWVLVAGMLKMGICIIVADIKGKKKGADRPALFAFFLVPVFLAAFLAALPTVLRQVGDNVQRVGNNVSSSVGR